MSFLVSLNATVGFPGVIGVVVGVSGVILVSLSMVPILVYCVLHIHPIMHAN